MYIWPDCKQHVQKYLLRDGLPYTMGCLEQEISPWMRFCVSFICSHHVTVTLNSPPIASLPLSSLPSQGDGGNGKPASEGQRIAPPQASFTLYVPREQLKWAHIIHTGCPRHEDNRGTRCDIDPGHFLWIYIVCLIICEWHCSWIGECIRTQLAISA